MGLTDSVDSANIASPVSLTNPEDNQRILLLASSSVIAVIPIFLIKKYISTDNFQWIYLCGLLYLCLIYIYVKLFEKNQVSSNYIILQIIQILLVLGVSYFAYGELHNTKKIIGVGLGIGCIGLLY